MPLPLLQPTCGVGSGACLTRGGGVRELSRRRQLERDRKAPVSSEIPLNLWWRFNVNALSAACRCCKRESLYRVALARAWCNAERRYTIGSVSLWLTCKIKWYTVIKHWSGNSKHITYTVGRANIRNMRQEYGWRHCAFYVQATVSTLWKFFSYESFICCSHVWMSCFSVQFIHWLDSNSFNTEANTFHRLYIKDGHHPFLCEALLWGFNISTSISIYLFFKSKVTIPWSAYVDCLFLMLFFNGSHKNPRDFYSRK